MQVFETFSGIGSQAKALENLGVEHEIVATCDWDINAIIAYDIIHNGDQELNFYLNMDVNDINKLLIPLQISSNGKMEMNERAKMNLPYITKIRLLSAIDRTHNCINVTTINGAEIPNIDLLTYSFPCQDLSLAGSWQGNEGGINRNANNRSSLLWEIDRILHERYLTIGLGRSMPRFLLMENVSNILSRTHRHNFNEWLNNLEGYGYKNKYMTLDARKFGVPQSRVRTYMVSVYTEDNNDINDYINEVFNRVGEHNLHNLYPQNNFSLNNALCVDYNNVDYLHEALESNPNATQSRLDIYSHNLHIDAQTPFVPTITTKQDRHPNSGLIDFDLGDPGIKARFRYLTPRECFILMGFDENDFQTLMNNNFDTRRNHTFFSRDKLNKMAGNSICVNVLESIFSFINEMYQEIERIQNNR